jgi:DNA mismatch repair protein MutS2
MKPISPNTKVQILSLKLEGTVVEQLKTGEYKVACGSMTLVRPAKDLEPLKADAWKKYSHLANKKKYQADTLDEKPVQTIDLHGMRVLEALAHIETFLDKALMADCGRVEIIHGVGTGALMQAVHEYLKKQSYVKRFHLDENNTGTTWVYF